MSKLSTDPYKGVRDFYPEDEAVQKFIFKVWRDTVESFGYVQYDASPLESAELYKEKSGEEIVNEQTYTFTDRGDREVTLRPEMTPTVARMVAAKRRELSFPLRWYSIPNVFRYERPQKGRLREHLQLNCDFFGVDSIEADVEAIALAYKIMKNFGARDGDFVIRINSRKLLNETLEKAGIIGDASHKLQKLIDKKNKIADFEEKAQEIIGKIYDVKFEANEEIQNVLAKLSALGVGNAIFDPDLVRGFDYYTGIVFEVFDTNPENNRSLFGGGRYDDLLSLFGEDKVTAVGFGMGDVTIRDFLESRNLIPAYNSPTKLYIVNAGVNAELVSRIAADVRDKGINVAVDFTGKKIGDQIKKAVKDAIEFVAIIGELELASKEITVKHLPSETERKVPLEEVAEYIKGF
jgi:histidyl-tRNA synthetase